MANFDQSEPGHLAVCWADLLLLSLPPPPPLNPAPLLSQWQGPRVGTATTKLMLICPQGLLFSFTHLGKFWLVVLWELQGFLCSAENKAFFLQKVLHKWLLTSWESWLHWLLDRRCPANFMLSKKRDEVSSWSQPSFPLAYMCQGYEDTVTLGTQNINVINHL